MLTRKPTIANIAVTNPAFSTLEAAAIQGGVAVLSNKTQDASGNFTVFVLPMTPCKIRIS
jgi:transforming growth factor-beta-induced protein